MTHPASTRPAPDDSDDSDLNRLSRINTRLSLLREAHCSDEEKAARARIAFFERYDAALRAYFFGIADGNRDLANDAYGDLKVKFMMGRLEGYDPGRGLFRNFLKTCAGNVLRDVRRRSRRILLHEESIPAVGTEEEGMGLDAHADPTEDDMKIAREIDAEFGRQFEDKALTQYRLDEGRRPLQKNNFRFLQEIRRLEHAAAAQGVTLSGDQLANAVSQNLGIDPALSHEAYRARKSRAQRDFWFLFLDEVYDSAVSAVPDLEEVRLGVCEMGYWGRIGPETWEAWRVQAERLSR